MYVQSCIVRHADPIVHTLCIALYGERRLFEHNNTNKTKRRARVRCRRTQVWNKNSQRASRSIGCPPIPTKQNHPVSDYQRHTPSSLQVGPFSSYAIVCSRYNNDKLRRECSKGDRFHSV